MKTVFDIMKENNSKKKMADFLVKQKQPYEFKKAYARKKAFEFIDQCNERGLDYHVSVGGLDSIVLFVFLRSLGIEVEGISCSSLEDQSIQKVHRALGIRNIPPLRKIDGTPYRKVDVIREFGFPVISKEVATKIETLQNPTERNKTVRHAIVTGETGEYGGFQKNSRMKLAQKWLDLFGGYENENEGTNYKKPPFKVSAKCCYYLKEKPCDDWAKERGSAPFLGLMASEGGRREKALKLHGCNYFGKSTARGCPFAIFLRDDLLRLAEEMDAWYHEHWEEFRPIKKDIETGEEYYGDPVHLESIIPQIYGDIVRVERTLGDKAKKIEDSKGIASDDEVNFSMQTSGAQRTGCSLCGFGIHLEKRPHRFDKLRKRNQKEWEFLMYHLCVDENGDEYGWGRVLDYIGVKWEDEIE